MRATLQGVPFLRPAILAAGAVMSAAVLSAAQGRVCAGNAPPAVRTPRPSAESLLGLWIADDLSPVRPLDLLEFHGATGCELTVRKLSPEESEGRFGGAFDVTLFMFDAHGRWKTPDSDPGWIRDGVIYLGPPGSALLFEPSLYGGELRLKFTSAQGQVIVFRRKTAKSAAAKEVPPRGPVSSCDEPLACMTCGGCACGPRPAPARPFKRMR
ncbi:MAG: hypothetical protein ABSG86_08335 [Thermoguttaceae bacterium]|jgi:hypothetical protein